MPSSSFSSGTGTFWPSSVVVDTRARRRVPAAMRAERSAEFSRATESRWGNADLLSRLRRSLGGGGGGGLLLLLLLLLVLGTLFGGKTLFASQRFSGGPKI